MIRKKDKKKVLTTIRMPKKWKEKIRAYQEDNDDISHSSRTITAYIIQAIKDKMIKDKLI